MDSHDSPDIPAAARGWSLRWVELITAALVLAFALLLVWDSLRLGTGWADDGPQSGYFPLRIGLGLALCSAWLLMQQLRSWSATTQRFVEAGPLRDVAAVFLPTVAYVALIPWLGIYVPSALLIAWFMRRQGGYGWTRVLPVSAGVALLAFVLFERWFVQPLPKGPLEHWLGF
ncbi:tripartite tricarboxylate transporter TctB family protein [Mitsuaria sp. WAJ17]|uniref:tripartite tricarboxylate transporter TctB family protein n=1 Tax=Mitsuaria sp. WAJ17 TaxID=2761452 RepID=UPI00160454C9|nr:tripartite tricarboxylate transporter TctB family protein [Mitsuaria sp. WAJ17]MBB2484594.1 tripartite tricarboxylate transporter TctB family protein [Mitsuaria sp. WAJ17]